MNTSHGWSKEHFKVWVSAVFLTGATFTSPIYANPNGGTVAAGQASISNSGNTTTINQSSDRAVINWQGFSINGNEVTQFNQPSSSSMTLNRVTSANNPSQILGQLKANGRVMLINPAGIVFGPNSKVDVAGLIASTANVDDNQFMNSANNKFTFTQDLNNKAGIVNHGTITVADRGLVALVAPAVSNNGTINARLGKVALASGNKTTVDMYGDKLIQFEADNTPVNQQTVDADGNVMPDAVRNSGKIYADGGVVQISANTAENVVNNVVNMDGVVQARAVGSQNGVVILDGGNAGITKVSGTIDVSGLNTGERGGTVHVLGHKVGVMSGAHINASGKAGGGKVLVGGDYQGQGDVRHAKVTYVDKDATIEADATDQGDGGKIVVWSDETTRAYGTLSAQGGPNGGNGGLIETSSKGYLDIQGITLQLGAPQGKGGTYLLDPQDLDIVDSILGSGTHNVDIQSTGSDSWLVTPTGSPSSITFSDLNDLINGNSAPGTVIISTNYPSCNNCQGDITIGADTVIFGSSSSSTGLISKTSGAEITLEFHAANNIIVLRPIVNTSSAPLNLVFVANDTSQSGNNGSGGTIQLDWNGRSTNMPAGGQGFFTSGGSVTFTGDVVVTMNSGSGFIIDTATNNGQFINGGNITFNNHLYNTGSVGILNLDVADANITFSGNVGTYGYFNQLTLGNLGTTGGTITVTNELIASHLDVENFDALTSTGSIFADSTTFIGLDPSSSTLSINNILSADLVVENFNDVSFSGVTLLNGTSQFIGDSSHSNTLSFNGDTTIQNIDVEDFNEVTFTGSGPATLSDANFQGTNSINGALTFANGFSVSGTSGFSESNFATILLGGTITADSSSDLKFNSPIILTNNLTISQNTSNADITFNNTVTGATLYSLTLNTNGGAITFGGDVIAIDSLTITDALGFSQVSLPSEINTLNYGNITFANAVELTGTSSNISALGTITFADTVSAPTLSVTLTTYANVSFANDIDFHSLTINANSITFDNTSNVTTSSDLIFNGPVNITNSNTTFSTQNGVIQFASSLDSMGDITIDQQAGSGTLLLGGNIGATTTPTALTISGFDEINFAGNFLRAGAITIPSAPIRLTSSSADVNIVSEGDLTLAGVVEPSNTSPHNLSISFDGNFYMNNNYGGNGTDSNGDSIIEYPLNSITFTSTGSGEIKIYPQSNGTSTVAVYTQGVDGITFDSPISFYGDQGTTLNLNALNEGTITLNEELADNGSIAIKNLAVNTHILDLEAGIDTAIALSGSADIINIHSEDVLINQALTFDDTANTINIYSSPYGTEDVVVDRATAVTLNANGTHVNTLTQSSGNLTLSGDWYAHSYFDFDEGTVNFAGNTSLTAGFFSSGVGGIAFANTIRANPATNLSLQAETAIYVYHALGTSSQPFATLTVYTTPRVNLYAPVYADTIYGSSVARVHVQDNGSINVGGKLIATNGIMSVLGNHTYNEDVVFDAKAFRFAVINSSSTPNAPITVNSFDSSLATLDFQGYILAQPGGNITLGSMNLRDDSGFSASSNNGRGGNITLSTMTANTSGIDLDLYTNGTITILEQIGTSGTPLASVNFNDSNIVSLYDTIYTNDLTGAVNTVNLHTQAFSLNDIQDIIRNGGQLNIDAANYNEDFVVGKPLGVAAIGGTVQIDSMNITQASRLGGAWLADTGDIRIAQPTTLTSNTSLTVSDGNININRNVNGNYALVLTDNSSGNPTITVNGALGNSTPLNSFTVNGANATLLLGANISTQGSTITFNTPALLTNNVTLSDTGSHGIFINRILSGAYNLVATASNGIMNFVQVNVNNASLSGAQGVNGNVIVNGLTLGGSNGGIVNGVVGGFNDFRASIITKLAAGAAGDFIVNGCLVPGGCLNNKIDTTELLAEATPNSSDDDVCTAAAASKDPNAMKRCRDSIKIHKDLLPGVQANL